MSNPLFIINFCSSAHADFKIKPKKVPTPGSEKTHRVDSQLSESSMLLDFNRKTRKKESQL